jgi:hypothetical protein
VLRTVPKPEERVAPFHEQMTVTINLRIKKDRKSTMVVTSNLYLGFSIDFGIKHIHSLYIVKNPPLRLELTQGGNWEASDGVAPTQGNPRLPNLSNDRTLQK